MQLEKNLKTRSVVRKLFMFEDRILGPAFPKMLRLRQIDNYSCGPAVLASLYSNLGIRVSQKGIITSLRAKKKIKRYGLNIKDLARASRIISKGTFTFWQKEKAKVSDLDTIINKYNCPVAVEWQGVFYEFEDEDSGHYSIITRLNKETGFLRISDPFHAFAGVDRKLKICDFVKRWWDENEVKVSGSTKKKMVTDKRVMFVIVEKRESWPRVLGMTRVKG